MTRTQHPPRFWLGGQRADEQDRFFREALESRGWQPGDEERWDAAWVTGMPDPAHFQRVSPRRKLNHFPGNAALTVKSRLHQSLAELRSRLIDGYGTDSEFAARLDFFPRAYVMPRDYHALQQAAEAGPERRWILKPTNASKGKGVRVLRDVAEAPLARDWLVQEYLANPHTIRGHKYVLRLYVLISSLTPLRVYLYRQGFAKLASEPWDPQDADNPFSQLTNPDINARNQRAEVPVEFIDLKRYRAWLRDQGHDDGALFARIEDLVTLTAIAAVDAMRGRTAEAGADPRGCYELLGLDCLVDDTLKPWILECNLSPSLGICADPESGGRMEAAVKESLVRDLVTLVDIPGEQPPAEGGAEDESTAWLSEARAELARAGGFRRLLPAAAPERYLPCFSLPDRADLCLAEALGEGPLAPPRLVRRRVTELIAGEQLALHDSARDRLYRLNETASLIWLLASEGLAPEAIAAELARLAAEGEASPEPATLRREVWQTLGGWCRLGLLCQGEAGAEPVPEADATRLPRPSRHRLDFAGRSWCLEVADSAALARLATAFPLRDAEADAFPHLSVLREPGAGYALAAEGEWVAGRLGLTHLAGSLRRQLLHRAAAPDRPVVEAELLNDGADGGVLCLYASNAAWAASLVEALAGETPAGFGPGLRLHLETPARGDALSPEAARPIGLRGVLLVEAGAEIATPLDLLAALLPRLHAADARAPQAVLGWLAGVPARRVSTRLEAEALLAEWLTSSAAVGD
ncbi:hypothetical protein PRZ61_05220 [Halomonas pacifica]|uniref:hypothetical protein n=1 Tax=Bisbaumannia pacifica TaxID=77098 RepID=UPI00235A2013|nr:hypothetical protein [Halomonas pacifica]MDC8802846.1 hypothetical protein [Halomonas pacifica]